MRTVITSLFYIIAINVHLSSCIAIYHTELHNLFITAILCFICIFLIFAMSVSHHTTLSVRDRFTCLFDAVVAIMTIAVMALLLFSSFSIAFFFVVVAIFVFVIIALLWYCNVAFLALQFSWYSQYPEVVVNIK